MIKIFETKLQRICEYFETCFQRMLENLPSQHLADVCAAIVKASPNEKLEVLDAVDLTERFKKALPLLLRQIEVRIYTHSLI